MVGFRAILDQRQVFTTLDENWIAHALYLRTFAPIATAHLYCTRYAWRVACHVMYLSARTESKLNKSWWPFGNLICEYFCWMLGDPHFFFGRSLPFLILSTRRASAFHYTKKQKNLYVGSFNYFSYTIQRGSNWYMDTGVRDIEVALFKANFTWYNDICSKDLSNRLIYVVLNTHNLDMILQLKYMPIVTNPTRIASCDWKS